MLQFIVFVVIGIIAGYTTMYIWDSAKHKDDSSESSSSKESKK